MIERKSKIKGILAKIRADIQADVIPCMNANNITGGYFSVPLIIFSFIEYLGILWKNPVEPDKRNKNRRKNYYSNSHFPDAAIPYIRKYLGKVRPEYKKYGGLLYGLYRHSLVHHYKPNAIILNNKEKISWGILKNSKSNHLSCAKEKYSAPNGKLIGHTILTINLEVFYQDLMKSIDEFEKDVLKYSSVCSRVLRADKKLNCSHPENSLQKYIKKDLKNI
ncbi:MAG: hypothetical protein IH852_15280 [Bacteroidetes bacterium]|nr:hypothetical protein [Bacteroidota bacterium]